MGAIEGLKLFIAQIGDMLWISAAIVMVGGRWE